MIRRKQADRYHHGDLRHALVEAAAQVAGKESVDAVVLSALAKRVGVSGTAPFKHFESREALLVAVAEEAARRLAERTARAVEAVNDPLERQQRGAMAYVRFAVEETGYFRVLARIESLERSSQLTSLSEASRTALASVFGQKDTSAAGQMTGRSPAHLAAQALIYGLARMASEGLLGKIDGATAERLTFEATEVLGAGLEASVTRRRPTTR